jgi:hypothetical protein
MEHYTPIPRNNGFPLQTVHNTRINVLLKTQRQTIQSHKHNERNGSQLHITAHKVTNLFKNTAWNIAFRTCNTMYNQFCNRTNPYKIKSNVMYKLQWKTCNKSYVGQTDSGYEYDTLNSQDISKQITVFRHTHYTFSTIDMIMEIWNKQCSY